MENSVQKRGPREITVYGHTYNSITEFCNAYDLKYPNTSAQLRQGINPEVIIENSGNLPSTPRRTSGVRASIPCSYDGVDYPSMTAAADALGIPAHRIPMYMKANHCSVNEAIEALMQLDESELHHEGKGKREPCVVDGVTYPSRGAACHAYGVKYVSVHSRMRRDGLTFEAALSAGGFPRKHMQALKSSWGTAHLFPFTPDTDNNSALLQIGSMLKDSGLQPEYQYDSAREIAAVKISPTLHAISDARDMYILMPYPDKSSLTDIEIMIPYLCPCEMSDEAEALSTLQRINALNRRYAGVCLFAENGQLSLSAAVTVKADYINKRTFLRTYQRIVGTAADIYDTYKAATM